MANFVGKTNVIFQISSIESPIMLIMHIPVMLHTESGVCRTVKRGKTLA